MKPRIIIFLSIHIIVFLSVSSIAYAQNDSSPSETLSGVSKEIIGSSNTPDMPVTQEFKKQSIELLVGYGYIFHLNMRPGYIPQGEDTNDYYTMQSFIRWSNANLNLDYHYRFSEHYSLGIGLQYVTNFQLSLFLINRIIFTLPQNSLKLYADIPVGFDVLMMPYHEEAGVYFRFATRFGLSWQLTDLLGLHTNLALEMTLVTPRHEKSFWHVFSSGIRLSFGVDFSL